MFVQLQKRQLWNKIALNYIKINETEKFIFANYFIYFITARKQLVL